MGEAIAPDSPCSLRMVVQPVHRHFASHDRQMDRAESIHSALVQITLLGSREGAMHMSCENASQRVARATSSSAKHLEFIMGGPVIADMPGRQTLRMASCIMSQMGH